LHADSGRARYLREDGVELRPGVRVFCRDRDLMVWDEEGTIVEVTDNGFYRVDFDGYEQRLSWDQISPTEEERQSDAATAWRRASRLQVFLCHASEDKSAVRVLQDRLGDRGYRAWIDEKDIPPGAEWDVAIRDAIRESHVVLVCLSRTSVEKTDYVQKELRVVLDRADEMPEGRIFVIPVRLDDCAVPNRLAHWQRVDLDSSDAYERLESTFSDCARRLGLG
jgi:TIR domain